MGVYIPILAILTGLVAVVGSFMIKFKKLDNEKKSMSNEDLQKIKEVLLHNEKLDTRVQNLEAIITSMDKELLSLKTFDQKLDAQKVEEILNHLKKAE